MRTNESARLTLVRDGDGQVRNTSASTISGCERVDGITSHRTQSQALSELLSELERQIRDRESKYYEVLDTLSSVMARLAVLLLITINTDTTDQ